MRVAHLKSCTYIRRWLQSGDMEEMYKLLETAAGVNETAPEQVSAIINELFL